MQTGQVFVSHTSDMAVFPAGRSFVQAALDGVTRAGMAAVDMRYFAARDGSPAEYCRQRVAECEIYVAVVGFRYGSLVPDKAVSYTELEFAAAAAAGLPRLVFLLEDTVGVPAGLADADRGAVEGFRGRLRDAGLVVRGFASADGLELEVFHALAELAGAAAARPVAASRAAPATIVTLPRDVTAFTGRKAELGRLAAAARSGGVVSIHAVDGMPGVGKTALVTRAAHLLAGEFPDGQLFVGLHAHTPGMQPADPTEVLGGLLACTGMDPREIPEGLEARAQRWRGRLAGKRVLLVLDDAAGHAQVEPLLPGTGGCLVLVTSRRRLIALPGTQPLALDTLPPAEAAELLTRLSGRAPDSSGTTMAAANLVALCGYLPLAIALLAGRLAHHPGWSLPDLAADFAAARDRLAQLAAGDRPGDPAVTAAFDMSYNGLPRGRQRLFRFLGLCPGADIDAFAAAALAGIALARAREDLDALYGDHFLDEPAPGRYRLHDLLREYACALTARCDRAAGRARATGRLLDYYQHAALAADRHLARRTRPGPPPVTTPPVAMPGLPGQAAALAWMHAERASLLACIDCASAHGQPRRVIALTAAMAAFLDQEGSWPQAAVLHRASATAARRLGDRLSEAGALQDLGRVWYLAGECPAAAGLQGQALAIYQDLGDRLGEANARRDLGRVLRMTGDYPAAARQQGQALVIYRDLGDRLGEANVLRELGRVRAVTGDYPAAARLLEQGLAIHQDLGGGLGEAYALQELGRVRAVTGDYPAAARLLKQALAIHENLSGRPGEAAVLRDLGRVLRMTGDYPAAARLLEQALAIYQDLGSRLGEAVALRELGRVRYLTRDYPAAADLLERSVSLFREAGDLQGEAEALNTTGALLAASAGPADALAAYRQALRLARQVGSPLDEAQALEGAARCAAGDGDPAAARDGLREAIAIYQRIGAAEARPAEERQAALDDEIPANDAAQEPAGP
jgi:tetratricopeptide (TPR) repeat protein